MEAGGGGGGGGGLAIIGVLSILKQIIVAKHVVV